MRAPVVAPGLTLNYHYRMPLSQGSTPQPCHDREDVITSRSESRTPLPLLLALPSARGLSHAPRQTARSVRRAAPDRFHSDRCDRGAGGWRLHHPAGAQVHPDRDRRLDGARAIARERSGRAHAPGGAGRIILADLSSQLRLVRHVRIVVKNADGARLAFPPSGGAADGTKELRA